MFKVVVSPQAQRELKKISKKHQKAIYQALLDLKEDPLSGKPLTRELRSYFSYRVNIYRIIYKINLRENTVRVISAGHRSRVYD